MVLDSDLAALYAVETKQVNRAVKRNAKRFPQTFMFQLTREESLRYQIGTSKGGRRYLPYVFTEHGVVMLSSVLNSDRAIEMSILVVNAFVRMRELIASNKDMADRLEKLERGHEQTASVLEILVGDIDRLSADIDDVRILPEPRKIRIGFQTAAG